MESPPIWTRSSLNMQLHIIKIIHYNITHYTTHIVTFNRGFTLMKWMPLQAEPRVGKCQGELWLGWSSRVRGDEVSCSDILTSVTLNVPIMIFKHWICRAVDTFTLYEAIFALRLIFRYGKEVVDIYSICSTDCCTQRIFSNCRGFKENVKNMECFRVLHVIHKEK